MEDRASKRAKKSTAAAHQTSMTAFFDSSKRESKSAESATKSKEVKTGDPQESNKPQAVVTEATESASPENQTFDPIIPRSVKVTGILWSSYNDAVIYCRPNTTGVARSKVAAFDMDGTLLVWRSASWPSNLDDYELWNASVISKLQDLYDNQDYQLLIITNQGGIRKAHTGKRAARVKALVEWLTFTIGRPLSVIMSTDKKMGYHKPSVKIWEAAQKLLGPKHKQWNIEDSFFVGDSVGGDDDPQGGTDIGLATNVSAVAGTTLAFYTPTDYFGPSNSDRRSKTVDVPVIPQHVLDERAAFVSGKLLVEKEAPFCMLLCGAQGSGKSTFASKLVGVDVFSQDTIRDGKAGTRQQVETAVREALQDRRSVVVDRMHLDTSQRAHFLEIAKECNVTMIHAIVFDPPVALVTKRVRERQNHIVSGEKGAELAKKSADALAYPTYDEGFTLINVVKSEASAGALLQRYSSLLSSEPMGAPTSFPLQHQHSTSSAVERLPAILAGTMKLGRRTASATVSQLLDTGIAGVDCAPTYNNEDLVGESLRPDSFCITKVPKRASTADEVTAELESSLSKLKRSSVDLLLLHWPKEAERIEDVWRAMEALYRDGKARALGVCNFNVAALHHLLSLCVISPVVVQIERHPMLPQWDVVDFCAQRDVQLQAHTPLGQGNDELFAAVQPIAEKYEDATTAQVLLAWNLQQGVAIVPKCSSRDHMEQLQFIPTLRSEDILALNELAAGKRFVAPPFMYGSGPFCWGKQVPR